MADLAKPLRTPAVDSNDQEVRARKLAGMVEPMLVVAGPMPTGERWPSFEFKWDGVRAVIGVDAGRAQAMSRNNLNITASNPELQQLPAQLAGRTAVLDGELVTLDAGGEPSFSQLQLLPHRVLAANNGLMAVTRVDAGDTSTIFVAGRMIVLDCADADQVMQEIATVQACWLDPAPRQLWAAVCRVLGVDYDTL